MLIASHYPHEPWLQESLKTSSNSLTQVSCLASWHHHANMKICKVCNESLMEYEYCLLITCSPSNVNCKKYDVLLSKHDHLSIVLNFPPRRVSTYVCTLLSHLRVFTMEEQLPFLGKRHVQEGMLIWSHRSNLVKFDLIMDDKICILFYSKALVNKILHIDCINTLTITLTNLHQKHNCILGHCACYFACENLQLMTI